MKAKICVTTGDPAGIGPEIVAKAMPAISRLADIVVIGTDDRRLFKQGKVSAKSGKASMEYLDAALKLILSGEADALVTCPVSKEAINLAGYRFSGHTEYLARKTGARRVEMMLLNGGLRFVLATRHIPLKKVPASLSERGLRETTMLAFGALKRFFCIKDPRIVMAGLNPHASDNGIIGDEELKVISPAVSQLKRKIRGIEGPVPADIAIAKASKGLFDCVIAMYHDQALIPLKLTGSGKGVNLTLGLDFVRTSPLHGTAFDIAGKGIADPSSLIEAVALAAKCTSNLKNL